jgi:hypothetical protein
MSTSQLPGYYDSVEEAKQVASNLLYLLERSGIEFSEDARDKILREVRLINAICF